MDNFQTVVAAILVAILFCAIAIRGFGMVAANNSIPDSPFNLSVQQMANH